MATRISGKQTAARITAVVAAGSFAVAGLGFIAVDTTQTSAPPTPNSSLRPDDDTSQAPGTSENDDSSQTPGTTRNTDSSTIPQVKKTVVRQKTKSAVSPVSPGTGGSASGKSSGS
jgi:hypothetical protein